MSAPMEIVKVPGVKSIVKIVKLKSKKGQNVSKGTLLCLYKTDSDNKVLKLKSSTTGTVREVFVKEGEECLAGEGLVSIKTVKCSHPTVMKDMCADCGADLRLEHSTAGNRKEDVSASVAMVHSIPELIVSEEQAKQLGKEDEQRLLKNKKLVLLVDLDQTLIHTTNDNIPPNLKDVHHFQLWHGNHLLWYHTRFRPGTQQFLENISQLFELHICTFGVRMYAHVIAKMLDPDGKYFSHRILSRDECFNATSKTANLKALFPCGDAMVCIIDDREDVWNHVPNLIHVKPYRFFQGTADINAPPGLDKTEEDDKPMIHRVRRVSQSSTDSKKDQDIEMKDDAKETKMEQPKTVENVAGEEIKEEKVGCEMEVKDSGETEVESQSVNESKNDPDSDMKIDVKDVKNEQTKIEKNVTKEQIEEEKMDCKVEVKDMYESEVGNGDAASQSLIETSNKETVKQSVDETVKMETDISEKNNGQSAKKEESALAITNGDAVIDNDKDPTKEEEKTDDNINKTVAESDKKESGEKVTETSSSVKDDTKMENENMPEVEEEMIEWDDEDDYLFYLEETLKNIHSAFFSFYNQMKGKDIQELSNKEKPSLKDIIPYIKKKVLKGCNIVFSGVIPTNMVAEKSRAYIVAKAYGANIQQNVIPKKVDSVKATTHVVAAKLGTEKVRSALKYKDIKIVNVDWLWSCAERWERVEEVLFPLTKESNGNADSDSASEKLRINDRDPRKRKKNYRDDSERSEKRRKEDSERSEKRRKEDPAIMKNKANENWSGRAVLEMETENISSVQDSTEDDLFETVGSNNKGEKHLSLMDKAKEKTFSLSYNPIYAFSDDDIAYMDKEVDDILDEDEEDDPSSEEEEARDARLRQSVLKSGGKDGQSSSEESLTGETPRGWGIKKMLSPKSSSSEEDICTKVVLQQTEDQESDSENVMKRYDDIMTAFAPESDSDEYQESIGSVDDEIADAVEKEFLS